MSEEDRSYIATATWLSNLLPGEFHNEIHDLSDIGTDEENKFKAVIRSNLYSVEDIKKWKQEFADNTCTSWIAGKTGKKLQGSKVLCRREFVCQHSNRNKSKELQRGRGRGWDCKAKLGFRILSFKPRSREKKGQEVMRAYLEHGLLAEITINNIHSHEVGSIDSLSFLRYSEEVRDEFYDYFNRGCTVNEAMSEHESKLRSEHDPKVDNRHINEILANAAINPRPRTVYTIYTKWRHKTYGPEYERRKYTRKGSLDPFTPSPRRRRSTSPNKRRISTYNSTDPSKISLSSPQPYIVEQIDIDEEPEEEEEDFQDVKRRVLKGFKRQLTKFGPENCQNLHLFYEAMMDCESGKQWNSFLKRCVPRKYGKNARNLGSPETKRVRFELDL